MKIIRFRYEDKELLGQLKGDVIIPFKIDSLDELIAKSSGSQPISQMLEPWLVEDKKEIPVDDVTQLPVIERPKQDVICLGINYAAHAEESARFKKEAFSRREKPIYFSKRVNRFVGNGEEIDGHLDIVEGLDYEAELAVIMGRDTKNVSGEEVRNHIFGYTILNDMSARNLQTDHSQWYFGKSLDDFTPIGPVITTADEIAYPPELAIRSYVNDELRQDSNTNLLINSIDNIVEELSRGINLGAGTIIATGTPAGVGMGFVPPKFLSKGDKVVCEIEGIGRIENVIK